MFDIPPPVAAEVTVVSVSETPAWEPGVKTTLVLFLGRRGDGAVEPFYVSWFASDPLPPLGSRCRLTYRKALPEQVGNRAPPMLKAPVVDGFQCDGAGLDAEDTVSRSLAPGK
ncbi:MAG: hypothetical protein IR159_07315 [Brevundimonas sp.]|nr:hypothetical protein [Brevundimonas sp.]